MSPAPVIKAGLSKSRRASGLIRLGLFAVMWNTSRPAAGSASASSRCLSHFYAKSSSNGFSRKGRLYIDCVFCRSFHISLFYRLRPLGTSQTLAVGSFGAQPLMTPLLPEQPAAGCNTAVWTRCRFPIRSSVECRVRHMKNGYG